MTIPSAPLSISKTAVMWRNQCHGTDDDGHDTTRSAARSGRRMNVALTGAVRDETAPRQVGSVTATIFSRSINNNEIDYALDVLSIEDRRWELGGLNGIWASADG